MMWLLRPGFTTYQISHVVETVDGIWVYDVDDTATFIPFSSKLALCAGITGNLIKAMAMGEHGHGLFLIDDCVLYRCFAQGSLEGLKFQGGVIE